MLGWLQKLLKQIRPAPTRESPVTAPVTPAPTVAGAPAPTTAIVNARQTANAGQCTPVPYTSWQQPGGTAVAPTAQPLSALADALREEGHDVALENAELQVGGLKISVHLHESYREGNHQRTVTETRVAHRLFGDKPIVEFQFGAGADTHDAMLYGFRSWCQLDLIVLLDALRDRPEACQYMTWNAAEASKTMPDGGMPPAYDYRVLFGPIQHFLADPARLAEDEDPGFCPCCSFTQSLHAFLPLLREGGTIPARVFVARDADGAAIADCRINGEDYEPVQQALIDWVAKWQDRGFEWRKQYVLALPMPRATRLDVPSTALRPSGSCLASQGARQH